ncbi:MAG: hypothetical protein RMI35_01205, partial [Leptospiraceae bacterium]|nr:hypothetical protein [Leptospiraceae bacterium]
MKSFRGTFYLFYYPDDWELKIIENIPSLFHPQGSGALIVVAFRYHDPEGVDTKRELLRYLKAQNIYGAEHRIVNYELSNSIQASTIEYMHKDRFWFANM